MDINTKEKFQILLNNLWYTWYSKHILPIIDLYGDGWRKNSPPSELIMQFGNKRLEEIISSQKSQIDFTYEEFIRYITDKNYNFDKLIAYFCLEYAFVDWLQIYSGGLGVLAADFIKQCSDSKVNCVGIGLFYHEGFFHQDFDNDGNQLERYIHQDADDYPLSLALDKEGHPIEVTVHFQNKEIYIRAWELKVGRISVYLLDTNYDKNKNWEDKKITARLYGGDKTTRIIQEFVLGIGGVRIIEKLGIKPEIYHMNEGHSAFLLFEILNKLINKDKHDFDTALIEAKKKIVFTNHTLKPAGNDVFEYDLFKSYFNDYCIKHNLDFDKLFQLGNDSDGHFSMTILGLNSAYISNAVSSIHAVAAKNLWPNYSLKPITNGVHLQTWISPEIQELLRKYIGENWFDINDVQQLQKVFDISNKELWQAHKSRKTKLIETINYQLNAQLNPDFLTIAWSRRLTAYKRPELIISDLDRLGRIVNNSKRPVQILIAGKSHPQDLEGKNILKNLNNCFQNNNFKGKVIVIPGYNWQLARRMVAGADIWLNTPYRFEEACGTSGMKAAANGGLNLTSKDGWADEIDWYKKGWVIAEDNPADSLYDILEFQIAPLYYDSLIGHYNIHWVEMMKYSINMILNNYSSRTMLQNYIVNVYNQ
jgi:glycogen phosphorylase